MQLPFSRRSFMQGMAVLPFASNHAQSADIAELNVINRIIDVNGRAAKVFGIENNKGGSGLSLLLDKQFKVRLRNGLSHETLVHWHGLKPPSAQDGVPMLSQDVLTAGEFFDYDFANTRSGTHWMHSHVGLQEQQLLSAPLIVHETAVPLFDEQEHVVMLHDFSFRDPQEILEELKRGGGGHAAHSMPGMVMPDMLNDVKFDAYLANDRTLGDPDVVRVDKGGNIRLRIINACAASNLWIDLGGLQGQLIAVDGNAVFPISGSLFPLAIAQRADIRLKLPASSGAWPILFRPEGLLARTGIILASGDGEIAKLVQIGEMAPPVDLAQEMTLRSVAELPKEPVTRTEVLQLTGGDEGYSWGLNGKPSMHDSLFSVKEGERVDVIMQNMTTMAHPMHLHGHYFKVVAINNVAINGALRDTVLVPPSTSVTIRFDADNPGSWAFHCHHLYHMNSGMMGAMTYTSAA
jgi:FtsP/CotA-like multicopper oxidase with cupredoxin domain